MELMGPYLAACVLLLVAGAAKAARPGDTARAVAETVRLRPTVVRPIVRTGAAVEVLVGAAGLARPSPLTAGLVACSYLGFAVFVGVVLARGGPLASCGCFGTPDTPATRLHVVVDLALAASAVAVASTVPAEWLPRLLAVQPWRGVPLIAGSLLCAALSLLALSRLAELGGARRGSRDRPGRTGVSTVLVDRAAAFLETRLSRRSFINRSAIVGSAVAVGSGVDLLLRPGTAYAAVCRCGSSSCGCGTTCCSGFSEFCCSINDGFNYCPADTVMGGWWMADNSSYCGGPRYYMDCHATCGCTTGCGGGLGILRARMRWHLLWMRSRRLRLVGHRLLPVPLRAVQSADRLHGPDRLSGGGVCPTVDRRSDVHDDIGRRQLDGRDERVVLDHRPTGSP